MTIEAAVTVATCRRSRWESTATLRLRYARLFLSDAVFSHPVAVTAHPVPFEDGSIVDETIIDSDQSRASIESLRGVDCAMLSLADVDLSRCRFAGAFHLDQLRLDGHWEFSTPPNRRIWRRGIPFRWTQRQVVAEERQWRALPKRPAPLRAGWDTSPGDNGEVPMPGESTLAIIYRQLRKAREDAKDEPGAADFYYGEMEMRRHSHGWRKAERWLLQAYWLLSGYGLRAARALGWLAVAMLTTILLMTGYGLPDEAPKPEIVKEEVDGKWKTIIDKPDPENATGDRFTGKQFEKALNVTLNSVVFRSSGQDLTTAGTYIEMTSRLFEPVLLGFAALAIRGRVKRSS